MEENSSSDDEMKTPLRPQLGGKKIKLNDGSSQDSLKESDALASGSKDEPEENVDSGLSADKSESTSNDDKVESLVTMGPMNEVVSVAPSSSNVRTILLNIRRPRRSRNYRKRKTPGADSDSNTSRDSDDLSGDENQDRTIDNILSDEDSNSELSEESHSVTTSTSSSAVETDEDNLRSDSDDSPWLRMDEEEETGKKPSVLSKTRPKHSYIILREIINREMGLTFPYGKKVQDDVIFEQKFYGSLHAVYRMEYLHNLIKHKGCVNSINFHPEGRLLASGSDDTHVIVWDWAKKKVLQNIKTGHKSNVFQSKFLYLNADSQINLATCARDGQVRLIQAGGSGGTSRRRIAAHSRAAHKLHVSAAEPHVVLSAGEDGLVLRADVRHDRPSKLIHVRQSGSFIPLYSVAGHPLCSHELLLAGRDRFLRVYDTRHPLKPLAKYCPGEFLDSTGKKKKPMHLTCAIYNHDGSEILGSYNDEDIYLFDAKKDIHDEDSNDGKDGYTHRYSGHRNSATYKGVAFFGPKSEYIVSGSDCSNIYIWEKKSEAIVQWMEGDVHGVVNCIESHPRFPVMATSGLDKDVKIWIPKRQQDPDYAGLEKVVRENSVKATPLFNDFLPTFYSAFPTDRDDDPPYGGNIEFEGNVCTAF
ncbi:DDB1- and CUL4-associated factor 8-like [Aricia agestis]|uniref:DDB1- and CUL4-associated factor 8-like n=1 Tax=Aricia agestis TaxID=91739 RepID=UPI001C201D95|nr:DDB1- and CUL4-associated factor 8-like [Aricia agestis]